MLILKTLSLFHILGTYTDPVRVPWNYRLHSENLPERNGENYTFVICKEEYDVM